MISLMKNLKISTDQKIYLEALHDASLDGRVRDRIKATLLRSEGWSTSMIAQALRLHETTIAWHLDDYVSKNKLAPENGGSQLYLNKIQTDEVVAHPMLQTYRCSYEIIEYIRITYEIRFSISGLNKWLHQHSFIYKYLQGVPHKFDEAKQADFIERYNELKSQEIDKPIFFMDAMHPTQAMKVSCGWIKKGHDKANELNIELHNFPPYSTNLNPIERLWKVMNEHVRNHKYFSTAKEFRDKIEEFFISQTLPKTSDILGSGINDDFQLLNSAS
ncbi:transposase [Colwellia sp. MB3u-70]|uniref:transposase n=1 Tax=unclassified Colwellia TaxID=196834 RepID=UPI0015F3F8A3|nr:MULTISPECIES: transposase [unclassified Colwellia]MBA6294079.1 transposase [Colwellia sp. MB3u-8]MBA6307620.1 transposase [Colwellia sp. MB3u-70]